ncbi:MAG: sensor histidine kinase [Phycisphaerae bacterium]
MTLAKHMTMKIIVLTTMLFALVGSAAWGLLATQRSVTIARDEYLELRMVSELDEHLSGARIVIETGANPKDARKEFAAALGQFHAFLEFQGTQRGDIESHEVEEQDHLVALEEHLNKVSSLLNLPAGELNTDALLAAFGRAQEGLKRLAAETDETIAAAQLASKHTLQATLAALALILITMLATAIVASIAQYRSVVVPIRRLRDGVRRIASGRFDQRLEVGDTDEYAYLAGDFNQVAEELHDLYSDLERRVREKSRELVRSERLASVGFLAAGIAHEINNPLNIISGYAELTLRRLHMVADTPDSADIEKALRIVRDESFRCKEIIEKLLSLSSSGGSDRRRVALDQITNEVATMVGLLKQYRERKVSVHCDRAATLDVLGNETELKQVVLNLAVNALDAVEPEVGEVRFEGRRRNGMVELVVSDNGRGMTAEARDHVFEPFYTQKAGTTGHGLGLGLSITHAIIESHGGRISVTSDGPNQGSRFLIELPPYQPNAEGA